MESKFPVRGWPIHGWLGLILVFVFWILNWSLPGLRTHWGFFPLWLGYCLTVDALVYQRKEHSLLTRNPRAYVGLFLISAPAWWLFELINWRTQNWIYDGRQFFSDLAYFGLASLSFSTVLPAVFGTAEWVGTFDWLRHTRPRWVIRPTPKVLWRFFGAGWLMLGLLLIWPDYFFPFVWISLYFILEPVNVWLKNRSLATSVAVGDWRPVFALWIGVLICAFFWEMWNFYSYPKWIYRVPFVDFWHIFEMPLLGYGGYLPFSLELLALYHLVIGVFKQDSPLELVTNGGPASHNYGSKGYCDIERSWGQVLFAGKLLDLPAEERLLSTRRLSEKQILARQQRGIRCPVCGETQFRSGRP